MGVTYEGGGAGSVKILSDSLAISPSTPDNYVVGNRKLINTDDSLEVNNEWFLLLSFLFYFRNFVCLLHARMISLVA